MAATALRAFMIEKYCKAARPTESRYGDGRASPPPPPPTPLCRLRAKVAQDIGEDAAVAEILDLVQRVDAADGGEAQDARDGGRALAGANECLAALP